MAASGPSPSTAPVRSRGTTGRTFSGTMHLQGQQGGEGGLAGLAPGDLGAVLPQPHEPSAHVAEEAGGDDLPVAAGNGAAGARPAAPSRPDPGPGVAGEAGPAAGREPAHGGGGP